MPGVKWSSQDCNKNQVFLELHSERRNKIYTSSCWRSLALFLSQIKIWWHTENSAWNTSTYWGKTVGINWAWISEDDPWKYDFRHWTVQPILKPQIHGRIKKEQLFLPKYHRFLRLFPPLFVPFYLYLQ